jgi:DNA-binding GntR family transcriptional regulator
MDALCSSGEEAALHEDFGTVSELGNRFHDLFITASGNQKLKTLLRDVQEQVYRFRKISAAQPGRGIEAVREHRLILQAFEMRNVEAAERLVRAHILGAKALLLDEHRRDDGK